ncbi:hypothetical protein KSP40_PGU014055 [Platanthera guangdongensis]|uniref:26S proteasome complex subunit SEM1 n=1 Tax=Platanthera guangdongensis TaxID=2320717 RepID=A0ABR2MEM1_9ASPA
MRNISLIVFQDPHLPLYREEWDDKEEGKESLQQWEDDWDDDDVNDDFSRQLRRELESYSEKKVSEFLPRTFTPPDNA